MILIVIPHDQNDRWSKGSIYNENKWVQELIPGAFHNFEEHRYYVISVYNIFSEINRNNTSSELH